MRKTLLLLIIVFAALMISGPKAYLASNPEGMIMHTPVAPLHGRKSEVNFYSMLNNYGRAYKSWLRDGISYLRRKEYEQAILAFRKAVKLQPAAEEARFYLAWSYEKRGLEGLPGDQTDWDGLATKEYTAAIELADHLPARFNLAQLHRRHGRHDDARRHLEHIILISSNNAIGKKAAAELKKIFAQDMRPRSISSSILELGKQ